jgi:hypothetical protein
MEGRSLNLIDDVGKMGVDVGIKAFDVGKINVHVGKIVIHVGNLLKSIKSLHQMSRNPNKSKELNSVYRLLVH